MSLLFLLPQGRRNARPGNLSLLLDGWTTPVARSFDAPYAGGDPRFFAFTSAAQFGQGSQTFAATTFLIFATAASFGQGSGTFDAVMVSNIFSAGYTIVTSTSVGLGDPDRPDSIVRSHTNIFMKTSS